ncbi:MAG TPA: hypothetical protein DCK76_10440 [Desulfotomaculum sp.]|nr:MAG: Putative transmembrane transcriptional regulator (Anti-sigma factor) [Desulfotomaculum sp. 46_80]HAG11769.1 hypothetical protein [Desulfotomaculum sp.]HBY03808.1 hypothetical protein [Desulfotomaculum sp.]
MNCRKAKSILVSDEPLFNEHRALSDHLAVCSGCAMEAEHFNAISKALREMNSPVKAPDGLAAQVINRLRSESANQGEVYSPAFNLRFRWSQAWKRSLAAAAAAVLLIGGSMGVAARLGVLNISGNPAFIVKHTPPLNQPAVEVPVQVPETQIASPTGNESNQPQQNNLPESGQTTDPESGQTTDNVSAKQATAEQKTPHQAAVQQTTTEPRVFLNVPRSIECILWKIKVTDINSATDRVLAWAKTGGISYSVENEIPLDDGRTIDIFRFGAPKASADEFSDFISGLGDTLEKDRNIRDVTGEFSGKLERYHSLLAQKDNSNGQQTKQLDAEIKAVESELTLMDKETQEQVVFIVWLQN